jgi:CheY-like chemotaxis protein
MTILAVDDDVDDLDLIEEAIREIHPGIICVRAHNGEEVLDFLERCIVLPDFIFLDINMPSMNGVECLRQIRKNPKYDNITVTILTTSMNPETVLVCVQTKTTYLIKPNNYAQLVKQVSSVFGRQG